MLRSLLPVGLLLCLGAVTPLAADTITLQGGKTLEGRVISRGDTIVVEVAGGSKVTLPKSMVVSIESGATASEELVEREAKLPAGDARALFRLATWCEEKGLSSDHNRLLWRVLELDPNHRETREALGYRRLGALWLTESDYQHHLGNVLFEGKWIPASEVEERIEQRESQAERDACQDALVLASRKRTSPEEAETAIAEFRQAPAALQRYTLAKGLESRNARVRQLAVRLTADLEGRRPQTSLTHVAVSDSRKSVRDEALRVLKTWNDPDTALGFIPYLESENPTERINATRALNVFPDRRSVSTLITTTRAIWAGFGRSHFAQLVQRSYVQDYELVSGGTGLVVSEVADPVVDTFIEGIVLDIDITRAEAVSRISTLERVTGQRFGADLDAWASWWEKERGREVAAAPKAADAAAPKAADR